MGLGHVAGGMEFLLEADHGPQSATAWRSGEANSIGDVARPVSVWLNREGCGRCRLPSHQPGTPAACGASGDRRGSGLQEATSFTHRLTVCHVRPMLSVRPTQFVLVTIPSTGGSLKPPGTMVS